MAIKSTNKKKSVAPKVASAKVSTKNTDSKKSAKITSKTTDSTKNAFIEDDIATIKDEINNPKVSKTITKQMKTAKANKTVSSAKKEESVAKKTAKNAEVSESAQITDFPEGTLEKSIKEKLIALYSLQVIDSQIDKIRVIRGELPLEVQDLEDEIEGLNTRLENYNTENAEIEKQKVEYQQEIVQSKELIKKYEQQQKNVRNNREFESLAKELEFQDLEIQLRNKRLKDIDVQKELKIKQIDELKKMLDAKTTNLKDKKDELDEIISETEKEEEVLLKKSEKAQDIIEDRYMSAYRRIRKSVRNGLAVVKIERHSCGGCFSSIPPQSQMEIKMHKKVLVCEYCGRILVDDSISNIVETEE